MKTSPLFGLGIGLAALVGGGCTTARTLSASTANQAAALTDQGVPCLRSAKNNVVTVWVLTPEFRSDPREFSPPEFRVIVKNGGRRPFALSAGDVAVSSGTNAVHLTTPEEYRATVVQRARAQLVKVYGQASELLAGQEGIRAYADGPAPRTVAGVNGQVLYDFSSRDFDAADDMEHRLNAEAKAQGAKIRAQAERLLNESQEMLTAATLQPGQSAGGLVRLEPAQIHRGEPLRLVIIAGGETHEFVFDVGS